MRIIKILLHIICVVVLTVLTQVGGVVYLLSLTTHQLINRRADKRLYRGLLKLASFLLLYFVATFGIVPLIARPLGRVQLPLTESHHLQPLTILTCLLNRHYVRPAMREAAFEVAGAMNQRFPGTTVNYLDANFPFLNGFPLFPHLSHNDGKKLDVSFCYTATATGKATNECPSFIGYGICEEPLAGEPNTNLACTQQGYWQYGALRKLMPQGNKRYYAFDKVRTKALADLWAAQPAIGKIFIEPHLKQRLKLTGNKIRFHGCQAVRHDDHLHIQLD